MAYCCSAEIWRRDPERRPVVAMDLAQQPEGEKLGLFGPQAWRH